MIIDTSKLKNPYTRHQLEDGSTIVVKLDDEGIVIDHVDDSPEGEVLDSTWKLYQEMMDGDDEDDDDLLFSVSGEHPVLGKIDEQNITEQRKNEIVANMQQVGYGNINIMTMTEFNNTK